MSELSERSSVRGAVYKLPPQAWFLVSAVFHYLGPSFAVLLFAQVRPLGVAWLRISTAALIFMAWRRPWRREARPSLAAMLAVAPLALVLAAMNSVFYLAIQRLPLATVGAIEFLGPIGLAAAGARSARNLTALLIAVVGAATLTDARIAGAPIGYVFAFANCALFALYIVLGHRIAGPGGIDRLATAMVLAAVFAAPVGLRDAAAALTHPALLAAAVGVGLCSSVIPYVTDQVAMARLPRATFALMLSILPAMAAVIGLLVLRQKPDARACAGLALVVAGVALHRPAEGGGHDR